MKIQSEKCKYFKEKYNDDIKASIEEIFNKGNFSLAIKSMREYLEIYPNDINAWTNYGKFLRLFKNNELAEEILSNLLPNSCNPNDMGLILIELIYLKIDEYDFAEAYEYFKMFQDLEISNDMIKSDSPTSLVRKFLMQKLGIYTPILERTDHNYFEQQIIEYRETDLLTHTFNYLYGTSNYSENNCIFNDGIDVLKLYEDIKKLLPLAVKTPNHNIFDTYIFYYPNIGHDKKRNVDYIKVQVIPNENNYDIVEFSVYRLRDPKIFINDFEKLKITNELKRELVDKKSLQTD